MNKLPIFPMQMTKNVSDVLAQTERPGFSEGELVDLLAMVKVHDLEQGKNKRDKLYRTLNNVQVRQGAGNVLVGFVNAAMSTEYHGADVRTFGSLRDQLNEKLASSGYRITPEGKLATAKRAASVEEVAAVAGTLLTELRRRNTHPSILHYCSEEFLTKSLFHAMLEASKSIAERVRGLTGLGGDGAPLYNQVFSIREPMLMINSLGTESDESEQKGFLNLLIGIHGHYRNLRAHSMRLGSDEDIQDFHDAMGLFSYVHRRLDLAKKPV